MGPIYCPHCSSGEVCRAAMLVANGTSTWKTTFLGADLHGDLGLGLGVGVGQTQLAAGLDPGPKPMWLTLFVLAVFTCFGIQGIYRAEGQPAWLNVVWWISNAVIVPGLFVRRFFQRRDWRTYSRWFATGWVCQSCGTTFTP
jgi:hypothetical protein